MNIILEKLSEIVQKVGSERANAIIAAVNARTPKLEIAFQNENEEHLFELLMDEVTRHVEEEGIWPTLKLIKK